MGYCLFFIQSANEMNILICGHAGEFKAMFTWRQGAPANRATRLEGLKHSPPLHETHLREIVNRAAANYNKQDGGQKKRFDGKCIFFYHSFTKGRFSVCRVLFCTLLIERRHQRQLTLKAALEYNAVLSPRLTSASRDEPFTWQRIARLEGCPG